jgi:hypothetical protein
MHSAPITEAAAKSLTRVSTGLPMYFASLGSSVFGECIELRGPRDAVYRSIRSIHDGLHRFTERPAKSYVLAVVDGVICLPREAVR